MSLSRRIMRLPTFERDFWQLRSGEEIHRQNPQSFWLPPLVERQSLRRGQAAKLIIEIESEDEGGQLVRMGERMWVIFSERVGDLYVGILDSEPASVTSSETVYLCFGAEIPFAPEHVIDIGTPPSEYIDWQLSQKPERIWPRNG